MVVKFHRLKMNLRREIIMTRRHKYHDWTLEFKNSLTQSSIFFEAGEKRPVRIIIVALISTLVRRKRFSLFTIHFSLTRYETNSARFFDRHRHVKLPHSRRYTVLICQDYLPLRKKHHPQCTRCAYSLHSVLVRSIIVDKRRIMIDVYRNKLT